MTRLNNKLQSIFSRMLSALLVILGFSACNDPMAKYGCPYAEYTIKGEVKDEVQKPIPTARVIVRSLESDSSYIYTHGSDTVNVDSTGAYLMHNNQNYHGKFRIVAQDANHQADSAEIEMNPEGGDGEWFVGSAEKNVNFTLKKNNE